MKPREYPLMQDCVERGIALGLQRARKHTDAPTDAQLQSDVFYAVMLEICEAWEFDDHNSV